MPELPDVTIYVEALQARIVGQRLERVRLASPFVLRTVDPPITEAHGRQVSGVRRLGKRIVLALQGDLFLVFHLMIAGRLRWERHGAKPPGKIGLAAFDFAPSISDLAAPSDQSCPEAPRRGERSIERTPPAGPLAAGTLLMTEASPKKRAALHLVRGEPGLAMHDPRGIEVLDADADTFRAVLRRENHTLKRALTDPHLFSGIGNAYSDEILHAARLSPVKLTGKLTDDEADRLFAATRATLLHWTAVLRQQFGDRFPGAGEITAFRDGFAVHGRYRHPCPICAAPVQRIRYAENETNYCARCQTEGRLLADRSLSRLLKDDWPRSIDEL